MRKSMSRNTGKKQKKGKPEIQDETITILQDISATLDAILKLLGTPMTFVTEDGKIVLPVSTKQQPQGPV